MMFRYIWACLQTLLGYVKVWPPEAHDSAWLGAAPAMEEEAVTVSLGPVGPLFQQLRSVIASLQGNSSRLRLKGVKAQIQILGQELEGLCIDLKGRSEAPADAITMCWMRQVRDLCYDTADYLDELMHFIHCASGTHRRRIRARLFGGIRLVGSKTFAFSRKLTWISLPKVQDQRYKTKGAPPAPAAVGSGSKTFAFSRKLTKGKERPKVLSLPKVKKLKRAPLIAKLSALAARVEDADERRKTFKLSSPASTKPVYAQAAAVMSQIPLQFHIDKLNKLLALDGNEMETNHKVVTIFGSAGVGKTALARTLYHQHRGRFQHRAFIRVSRDPDMRRLLTDVLSQIKAPPAREFSDVPGLMASITKHLQGKRYLIITDDLWATSTWDVIIRALPSTDYCRIITTTQVEDVALACCNYQLKHIYQFTPLHDDQSGKSESSSERMEQALNLVYNNLPPRLKTSLLYLNLYPEGYTIRKDELVKQWVSEGLITSVQGQDIEDTAGCYFDALISSGMIQSVETNYNGEVLSCTLHHMVLDLIRQKSMEENFVTIVNYFQTILGLPDKVRRLSVQLGGVKGANNIPENMSISQVRSLLFSGYFKCVPSILDYGLLQVLILHIWADQDRIFDLNTIGELYRLRYLKIESNITVKLPGKIRRLRHLGTLQVDATLCAVPSDIVHLEKLSHLRLPSESILPDGVGYMISLCTLGYFDLGSNSEDTVRGLDELANLQDLQLTCSTGEPAEDPEKNMQLLLGSVFQKLGMLQSVTLAPGSGSCNGNTQPDYGAVSSMSISCDDIRIVSPAPDHHLQRLELSRHCCIFSSLPRWLGELTQLCILKIAVRELSKEAIDILKDGLPALAALSLHVASASADMIVFGKGGFSVLRYFKFTCIIVPCLKFEADAMPNLQKLRLGFNATVVDKQGIIIEYLSGIKEISAIIGCVGVDVGSTWLKAVTNDARNPKVQWLGSACYGDQRTGHTLSQGKAQENYRIQDKCSRASEIMDETDGIQNECSEAGENSEDADRNGPRKQMVHGMQLQRMGQKVLVRVLTPIVSTVVAITVLGWLLSLIIRSVHLKQHYVATAGLAITVLGWLLSPIIAFLLPKILVCLGFDSHKNLMELENIIIPELKKTLQTVDQERMMLTRMRMKTDLDALDKMAAMLRHALEDAEDTFDHAQEKVVICDILHGAVRAWIARFLGIARTVRSGSVRQLQRGRNWFLRRSLEPVPVNINVAATDDILTTGKDPNPVTSSASTSAVESEEPVPVTTPSDSSGWWLSCSCNSFDLFKNCCTSTFNWSYEVVGITGDKENATILDLFLTAISRWKLKKRIKKVEGIVSEVKKSPLLGVASNNTPDDIANKNWRKLGAVSKREVFGREKLRDYIMARLRETPHGDAPSSSPCYSVIGIYGIAGSGKTSFAGYIRDYINEECKEDKLFDTIMCIHVSETFTMEVIFQEMLKDITGNSHSNISDHGVLNKKLKEALRGKRFFLILDDLWVKNKNDQQLEELISPLNVGLKGSKILVTARTREAVGALCGDEVLAMPDLAEDQYIQMFMHYTLRGKGIAANEFEQVGREIAKKLHRSPIAAVTVAGRLGANPNINFWKNVAKLDMLNDTMDALWWSYQQLNPDIRRCFEFCNIFPRRLKLRKVDLVRLWIAQGFVKSSCATEEMEDLAEGYIQELVSCSFLQPEGTRPYDDCFTIHDLLHDLVKKIVGTDCFRIENKRGHRREGWTGDVPRDVRHLSVQNYDGELITKKILGVENLRTLIIYDGEWDTRVEEKVIEGICMRLLKLRVLAIGFNTPSDKFLVPESIIQLKHLRYLAFRTSYKCKVILPSALAKLLHIQLVDFGDGRVSGFNFADLINLRHIFCQHVSYPHTSRLSSHQTVSSFTVNNEEGYEIKQLRDLNKLRGKLCIYGLGNVKSKEEALEANLAAKERITELGLFFSGHIERRTAEVEAEVLEGLCPPVGLEKLTIWQYNGSRYPDWMVGKLNGAPKNLQTLDFWNCSQVGPGPELEAFPHLRVLRLVDCSWEALPVNMKHLTSLQVLMIQSCRNIRSLPTLPQSLKKFDLVCCNDELMKGCQTEGDPNWLKIKHIREKYFLPRQWSPGSFVEKIMAGGWYVATVGRRRLFPTPQDPLLRRVAQLKKEKLGVGLRQITTGISSNNGKQQ